MNKRRDELSKIRDTIAFHSKYVCVEEWKEEKLDEYESKLAQADEKLVEFTLKIEELLNENRQIYKDGYMQGKFDKEMEMTYK